jgi:hypothetical protein
MENLKWRMVLAFVVAGGIWCVSSRAVFATPANVPFVLEIRSPFVDVSDLDLRDRDNRPIHSATARAQMANLFFQSAATLFLENLTIAKRALLTVLTQSWSGAFGWWKNEVLKAATIVAAWLKKTKIFERFLMNRFVAWPPAAPSSFAYAAEISFHSLSVQLLSSTTLLR